jgi:Leucine-rich repeat (LRR) protein
MQSDKTIENLNLSHNQLQKIPTKITKLKLLKNLNISWNRITHSIDFLPSNIKVNSAWKNRK